MNTRRARGHAWRLLFLVVGACCGMWYVRAQATEPAAPAAALQGQETKAEEKKEAKPLTAQELTEKIGALEADTKAKYVDLDTIWTLVTAFLVFWMQAGFALVETGLTRAKNTVRSHQSPVLVRTYFTSPSAASTTGASGASFAGPTPTGIPASGWLRSNAGRSLRIRGMDVKLWRGGGQEVAHSSEAP